MVARTVEAKLILAGEDRASKVIKQVEAATRGVAKAMGEVGKTRVATAEVEKLTRALDGQKRVLRDVEEVRRTAAARASSDMSHRLAVSRAAEVTKALDGARKAHKALDDQKRAGKKVDDARLADQARVVARLADQQKTAQRAMRETASAVRVQTDALNRARDALKSHAVPITDLTRHEGRLRKAIDDTTDAIRRQEKAEKDARATHLNGEAGRLRRLADEERRSDRRQARREVFGTLAAGAGVVAAHRGKETMWEAVRNIKEFDDAQKRQVAYTPGLTETMQAPLLEQAKRIGQQTQFTNTDVIKAQTRAMQGLPAGFTAEVRAEVGQGIIENVKSFSTLMEVDLNEGAEIIRSYLQMTQKDISTKEKALAEANKATNQIVIAAKLGGSSGDDIKDFINYATSSGTVAGLSSETLLTLGAIARRAGLRGDVAGTFIRTASAKLVSPTKGGRTALNAAGIDYDKFVRMPEKLDTAALERQFQNDSGKSFTPAVRARIDAINADKKLLSDREAYVEAVTEAVSPILERDRKGKVSAQESRVAARSAGEYYKVAAQSVDTEGLLREILGGSMTLAQFNKFFTDKHGGKAALTQAQFDEIKAVFQEIKGADKDPKYAENRANYIMSGVAGSLENLKGSWENFTLQIGKANEGLIKSVSDTAGGFLDLYSKLDTTQQQVVSLGGAALTATAGIAGLYKLTTGLFGSAALTGSATQLSAAAIALDAAAVKLGAGGAAAGVADVAGGAVGGTAAKRTYGSAAIQILGKATLLGGLGYTIYEMSKAAHDAAPKQFTGALAGDPTYALREELAEEEDAKRAPDPGRVQRNEVIRLRAEIERLKAQMESPAAGGRAKAVIPGQIADLEARLRKAQSALVQKAPIDTGLDALSGMARPAGQKIGEQALTGIAEGVKAEAPKVIDQGRTLFDALKDVFGQGIAIPMRFTPDGAGGGGSAGGGLIRASYGGGSGLSSGGSSSGSSFAPGGAPSYPAPGGVRSGALGGRMGSSGSAKSPVTPLPIGDGTGVGHVASRAERAAYIRAAAARLSIDPDTALRVAQSEGFDTFVGDQGRSFGDFQLFTGGGVGNEALAAGVDVRDPKNWRESIDFALKHARANGWRAFHGAARVGIGDRDGIGTNRDGMVASDRVVEKQDVLAGIRRGEISPELRGQLDYAAGETGVRAEVFSGGQPAFGRRTGSRRHDHGKAADLRLSVEDGKGGRRYLSMDDDGDRTVMESFIRNSVKAGATGVGAGPGYMGSHGIHIGGGKPGAWGADGKADNAPDWVKRALRDGVEDRSRGDTGVMSAPKLPMPLPPPPADDLGGTGAMSRAAERMHAAADRFERMRLNAMLNVELSGGGREHAKVKGMRSETAGPVFANLGVSMPQTRSV